MSDKKFKLQKSQIVALVTSLGSCMATDKITVDGESIGYMYREDPEFEFDSGWRFFAGNESQEYVDNSNNIMIYEINTIANYDRAIIPYLHMPTGTELIRNGADFVLGDYLP